MKALLQESRKRLDSVNETNDAWFDHLLLKAMSGQATADPAARIECLINCCHYLHLAGRSINALDTADEAVLAARQHNMLPLLRKALTFRALLANDTGDPATAIECNAEAIDIARSISDLDAEAISWGNMGVSFHYAALYQDALACNEHVLNLTQRHPELHRFRAVSLGNIALNALHLGAFQRGLVAARRSIEESGEPKNAGEYLSRTYRYYVLARLLMETGEHAEARERWEVLRALAAKTRIPRIEVLAGILEGLALVHAGAEYSGLTQLAAVLERARAIPAVHREALLAIVKAYDMAERPEQSLVYLKELMQLLQDSRTRCAFERTAVMQDALGSMPLEDLWTVAFERQEARLEKKVVERKLRLVQSDMESSVAERENARRDLARTHLDVLERMAVTAELRDDSTGEHSYRVGRLAALLARANDCDENTCKMVELAARLHDIGKVGIPDAILLKPGKLSEFEMQIMRSHAAVGAELLSRSEMQHLRMAEEIARSHHEWWDGTGYPEQMSGTDIPLAARLTALADVFDALTHKRPYKEAWLVSDALNEIRALSGRQFDPALTERFVILVEHLHLEHPDLDAYLGRSAHTSPFFEARNKIFEALNSTQLAPAPESQAGRTDVKA